MVYAYTQRVYPAPSRGSGLGWTAGVGRLGGIVGPALAGTLVVAGIAYPWGFSVFAATGLLAALAVSPVRVPGVPSAVDGS